MMPTTVDLAVAGKTRNFTVVEHGREIGSLFGTLGDTLYYGLFLVVVLAVALSKDPAVALGAHGMDIGVLTLGDRLLLFTGRPHRGGH